MIRDPCPVKARSIGAGLHACSTRDLDAMVCQRPADGTGRWVGAGAGHRVCSCRS